MSLPKQVEDQGKQADDLITKIGENTGEGGDQNPAPKDVEPDPTPAPDSAKEEIDGLKHKLKVLQGKYNAEIKNVDTAGLAAQISQLSKQVGELTNENAALKAKVESSKAPEPAAAPELSKEDQEYLATQDLEPRVVEIIRKSIPTTDPMLKADVDALKTKVDRNEKLTHEQKEAAFWEKVHAIPDFETINNDPEFLVWLSQPVSEYASETKQSLLTAAGTSLDAKTVVKIFNAFIEETSKPEPDTKPDPLEKEIEPGPGTPATPSMEAEGGKRYTPAQITQFYKDMATSAVKNYTDGPWAGREKECLAMQADIQKAAMNNRIIQ